MVDRKALREAGLRRARGEGSTAIRRSLGELRPGPARWSRVVLRARRQTAHHATERVLGAWSWAYRVYSPKDRAKLKYYLLHFHVERKPLMASAPTRTRAPRIVLAAVIVAGVLVAAIGLLWRPEAHVIVAPYEDYTEPCARGYDMWTWGVSSDGSGDHGPKSGGEQFEDPVWDRECLEHLATIQTITLSAIGVSLLALGILIALELRRSRTSRTGQRS